MRARWRTWLVVVVAGLFFLIGGTWLGDTLWFYPSQADRTAIESRYQQWHSALEEHRFADGYKIMSPAYRAEHAVEDFGKDFRLWEDKMYRLNPKCSLRVHGAHGRLYPLDTGRLFELWCGPDFEWMKIDGQWYLSGELELFMD